MTNKKFIFKSDRHTNNEDIIIDNCKSKKTAAEYLYNKFKGGGYNLNYYTQKIKQLFYNEKYNIKIWLDVRNFRNYRNGINIHTVEKNIKCVVIEHDSLSDPKIITYADLEKIKTRLDYDDIKHNIIKKNNITSREEIKIIHDDIFKLYDGVINHIEKIKKTNNKRYDTLYENEKKIESKIIFFKQHNWSESGYLCFHHTNKKTEEELLKYLTDKKKNLHKWSKSELADVEFDQIEKGIHKAIKIDSSFVFDIPEDINDQHDNLLYREGIYRFNIHHMESVTLLKNEEIKKKYRSMTRNKRLNRLLLEI